MGVCCYTFLKYLVMIFNLLYMMMGGTLLGLILWVYINATTMAPVTDDMGYNYVLYFLMVVGAIMFIMGLLGCCGACQESQCMLATFFALVLVLFMGQVAIGVWVRANEQRFTKVVTDSLTNSIKKDYGTNGTEDKETAAFDTIQSKLKCCGSVGPNDWKESHFNGANKIGVTTPTSSEYNVPKSCCKEPGCNTKLDSGVVVTPESAEAHEIYAEGCSKKILKLVEEYNIEIIGALLAILLIQVLAMILSMILCCTVRRIDHVKA